MIFKRDPILSPGSQSISFDSKVITQANYFESNGDAEIDIAAVEPLMASFSNNRRTITVVPFQSQAPPGDATSTPKEENQTSPSSATGAPPAPPHRLVAIVDAAHGGEERGAALTETLTEKNVTLGFARLLRHELELRNFAVVLLRDSDATLTLDQRASAANAARGGIYISLHAVSQGTGAGVYTALLPVEGPSKGAFHPWNAAQAPALPISRIVSAAIVGEMQKREIPVRASSASLRPLNNVFMPAVAVELAPGNNGIEDLTSANYQQRAASAIADAVSSVRERLGVEQ
jgi:N-acetylmuramoyl-L-alanine amidase